LDFGQFPLPNSKTSFEAPFWLRPKIIGPILPLAKGGPGSII